MWSQFEQQPRYSEETIETDKLRERLETCIADIQIAIERLGSFNEQAWVLFLKP